MYGRRFLSLTGAPFRLLRVLRLQLALAQADELEERIKQLAKASFSPLTQNC
jgi:hypothetical protein